MTKTLQLKTVSIALLLFLFFIPSNAQQTLLASGGNTSGESGESASYSVGQIVQNMTDGSDGSVIQGIQFYFASSTLSIIDTETNLNIATYPNPTTSILNLKLEELQNGTVSYQLLDLLGGLVSHGNITDAVTAINMEHLESATYLLKVSSTNNTIKTFKIIKN